MGFNSAFKGLIVIIQSNVFFFIAPGILRDIEEEVGR
jgi:hypothetical protein